MSADGFTAPAPPGAGPVEYASFARRLGAALLDSLVWIVGLTFFNPFVAAGGSKTAAGVIAIAVATAWFNYFAICEWRWGQTIGKNATGIRVLPLAGGRLSWQEAALRNLLRLVDLPLTYLGIDYMLVTLSPRSQRLGDRAAKTIVVRERQSALAERPSPQPPGESAPAAAELFGDAAEALGRHPEAGSEPRPAPQPSPALPVAAEPAAPAAAVPAGGSRWSAPGFPFATWGPMRSTIGLIAALLAAFVVPVLALAVPVVVFNLDLHSTGAKITAQGSAELAFLATALIVAGGRSAPLALRGSRLGLRKTALSFGLGLAVQGIFAYSGFAALISVLVRPSQHDIAKDLGLHAGPAAAIAVVAVIAVIAPIAEETLFRGMLFGGLRTRLGMYPSAAISAIVFGALHATTGVSAIPQLAVFGFILALIYERSGSVVPGICLHAFNNALALIVVS